jgi:hypothetical protein
MKKYKYIDESLNDIKSDNEEIVMNAIKHLITFNENICISLLELLNNTTNSKIRDKVALALVDNFKNPNIVPTLLKLVQRPDLKKHNAFLLFACSEYSDCKEHLELLVEFILKYDYHVAWNAYGIIINMPPPFDEDMIFSILRKIESTKIRGKKKEIISSLVAFLNPKNN